MTERILLVEDEEDLRMTLSDRLKAEGYAGLAADGETGLRKAVEVRMTVVLDVMLPKKNGYDVCRDIRKAGIATPIIMLTARGQLVDKVLGLKIGADDYVTKPFEVLELLARIEAQIRRGVVQPKEADVLQFGPVRIDLKGTTVSATPRLCRCRRANSACCGTLRRTQAQRFPAKCCSKRSGVTVKKLSHAPWTFTSGACGRSWRKTPNSLP